MYVLINLMFFLVCILNSNEEYISYKYFFFNLNKQKKEKEEENEGNIRRNRKRNVYNFFYMPKYVLWRLFLFCFVFVFV